jgi:hypothetical protein
MIRSGIFSIAAVCLALSAPLSFWLVLPAEVQAQGAAIAQLPQIFVEAITVTTTSPAVQGTFTAFNEEATVQGGLHYQIQLLGPAPTPEAGQLVADDATEYDVVLSDETITLLANETREIPFTYTPPSLPEGEYRLRIRWVTSQGRRLGWQDSPIRLGTPGASFVLLQTGPIILPNGELVQPLEGVNIAPGTAITIQGIATNTNAAPVTVTPRVAVYRWGMTGQKVSEENVPPVSLASQEKEKVIDIPLTAAATPDAYHVIVSLHDATGARISSTAPFRYVVTGTSAKVVAAQFDPLAIKQGETTTISATVVGPADRETTTNGSVTIGLLNNGAVVAEQDTPVTLDQSVQALTASFPLASDLTAPGLRVIIRDADGTVLDTYEVTPELTAEQLAEAAAPAEAPLVVSTPSLGRWGMLAALIVLAVVLVALLVWYRMKNRSMPVGPLVLLLGVCGALAGYSWYAEANGVMVCNACIHSPDDHARERVSIFMNKPKHEGIYPRTAVPMQFSMSYFACDNNPTFAEARTFYNNQAGWVTSWPLPAPVLLGTFTSSANGCAKGSHCSAPLNFSGMMSMGESFPHDTTTLQLVATMQFRRAVQQGATNGTTDVMNLFVKFPPLPTPTPGPTPSATTTTTPTPSSGPSTTPTPGAPGPTTSPTPTSTIGVVPIIASQLCTPVTQTRAINATASFTSSLGSTATWSAPGGDVTAGTGASFSTKFAAAGTKTVTVTNTAKPAQGYVNVNGDSQVSIADFNDVFAIINNGGPAQVGTGASHQNQVNRFDVNGDGRVTLLDATLIHNLINTPGTTLTAQNSTCTVQVTSPTASDGPFNPGPIRETE